MTSIKKYYNMPKLIRAYFGALILGFDFNKVLITYFRKLFVKAIQKFKVFS